MTLDELEDSLHRKVVDLCAKGDDLAEAEHFGLASEAYEAALELLPEPYTRWSAATWILTAIGDTHSSPVTSLRRRKP